MLEFAHYQNKSISLNTAQYQSISKQSNKLQKELDDQHEKEKLKMKKLDI